MAKPRGKKIAKKIIDKLSRGKENTGEETEKNREKLIPALGKITEGKKWRKTKQQDEKAPAPRDEYLRSRTN